MFTALVRKIIGSRNDRQLKKMGKLVAAINAFETTLSALDDADLQAKTPAFKERLAQGETLDGLLPEAFAVVREASKRVLGMRHFDVQLLGGMVLHNGSIAEMRTGEGKTLVATLPAYLNALSGQGVHVVTVNDYLAKRDANWMRPLYEYLGMHVGIVVPQQTAEDKRQAYATDIIYGTNNELGFDYLRDNMAFQADDRCQRGLNFAIVDEVDSILIDEARTPLIISGPTEDSSALYQQINRLVPLLKQQASSEAEGQVTALLSDQAAPDTGHFIIDEKNRQVELTETGHQYLEDLLQKEELLSAGENLYAPHNLTLLHHVQAALKANILFTRNVEYIVQGDEVLLVDEHTGRTLPGRRLAEGLHQAIEAKENLTIQSESQTLASTTFQNYFRHYTKLAGMTGTADTEAFEFRQIYGLDVVVIPTHKPMIRQDHNDVVYLTITEKYDAIIADINEAVAQGRPVLVGTASIESSERLSQALQQAKLTHQVLNAKFHQKEAEIIAQAGKPGAITIATNMAGRGTDIVLGGNWEAEVAALDQPTQNAIDRVKAHWQQQHQQVIAAGGLHIIATERHESRRIDNQLRGRAGRQGDPGSSRFYLSLEDDLMRIFASDRVKRVMQSLGMEKGEAIEHRMVTHAIEKAQRKVEGRNFDIRKQLLEYDDVANDQRTVIYNQRNELLNTHSLAPIISDLQRDFVYKLVSQFIPPQSLPEQWDIEGLEIQLATELNQGLPIQQWLDKDDQLAEEGLHQKILAAVTAAYQHKEALIGKDALQNFTRHMLLRILDDKWKAHLATMDHLRQGIHLRGYAQKNPKQEYKREAFALFQQMLEEIQHATVRVLAQVQIQPDDSTAEVERQRREQLARRMQFKHADAEPALLSGNQAGTAVNTPTPNANAQPFVRESRKVGRNEACPCGSGKKYKRCHGKII